MVSTVATTVSLPSSLAFLVSNFHSLVTIKLDSSNYLLWRIQVENVIRANGYCEFLEGTIECPAPQIKDSSGNLVVNPDYNLWKLIDTQLLSCLTASLSQSTLPYVLGLFHTHDLWTSLSNRYNSLTKNHIQELKCKMYNVKKTSTMEAYVDLVKEFSQKLAAAGSPMSDDDLIFHLLRGLPPVFNGFKSAVRTRGSSITFDEVITMLNGEDLQLLQDSGTEPEVTSALVATHANNSGFKEVHSGIQNSLQNLTVPMSVPMVQHSDGSNTVGKSQQNFLPQQQASFQYQRNFSRDRGFRGGRNSRQPCAICGRTNHITSYCYYKGQSQPNDQINGQWRSNSYVVQPQYPLQQQIQGPVISNSHGYQGQFPQSQLVQGQFPQSQFVQPQLAHSQLAPSQFPQPHLTQPHFTQASFAQSQYSQPQQQYTQPQLQFAQQSFTQPQAHFTGAYNVQNMIPTSGVSQDFHLTPSSLVNTGGMSQTQPWYFDSGATHHITNSLQNLDIAQPAASGHGIMVGNGSNIPISHTGKGQDLSSNSVQGSLSQGTLSNSELL